MFKTEKVREAANIYQYSPPHPPSPGTQVHCYDKSFKVMKP